MKRLFLIALLSGAHAATAQVVANTPSGVVVAHDGVVELIDRGAAQWRVEGVANATAIAADDVRVAVLDAMANEAVVIRLSDGNSSRVVTAETPVAAAFTGGDLWVLSRDAGIVQRVGGPAIDVGTDAAFLGASGGRLYVYSRVAGKIHEIGAAAVSRTADAPPYASDLEIAGTSAFLALPRAGKVAVLDLVSMKQTGEVRVGAVPVDAALAGGGTALTARILAVADPASRRVWTTESTQSTAKAFARGFLRGFLGLGLFGGAGPEFPTGVDRVARAGSTSAAYDTGSGTLYRFDRKKSSVVARNVAPGAWAVTPAAIVWWDGTVLRSHPAR